MKEKIIGFFRENIVILSIFTIILGIIILIIGILGTFFEEEVQNIFAFINDISPWSPYILILGLIIFGSGLYYLYLFISKRNFLMKEIETNKRSEFIKKHGKLKADAKHLPSKYKEILKQKEKELKIK